MMNGMDRVRANLASLVEEFRRQAAETAVVAHRGNRRYPTSYGELAELAGRFSAELARRGVVPGERVVLWGENSAEWIGVFFGCLLRGVIAVPLDAAGTSEFAARVIKDVAPKLIVGDAQLLETLAQDGQMQDVPQLPFSGIAAHLPAQPNFAVSEAVHEHTPIQIVFTSGTTAEPRGIVHTHRNILVTLQPIENEMQKYLRYERWFHPLRFLHSLPLSHVFGQFMALWIPALLAAEVHFAEQLEPARMTDLIRRERISVLIAVPRVLQLMRAHLLGRFPGLAEQMAEPVTGSIWKRWWRFRRVHGALGWKFWAVISGGATLPAELETFWNGLGFALIQGYGMTETAALVTLNHPFHIVRGSIGKPLPGHEVKLTGEGEILVRGDMVTESTWSAGTMHTREGDWLATGDLAEKDASGGLRFVGRKGDVIVAGSGMNVFPSDLEAAMAKQPGVRACVVVACEFAGGPEPVAVVLFPGSDEQMQAAVTAANRELAEYQQIRRVLRWPELQFPYTSTGKLIRRQVAQWACDTLHGRQQETQREGEKRGEAPGHNMLLTMIAEVTGEPAPARGDEVELNALRLSEDLHLDSLGRVQLQSELEQRLGLELEDDAVANLATLGDLRALVEQGAEVHHPAQAAGGTAQAANAVDGSVDADGAVRGTLGDAAPAPAATAAKAEEGITEHVYPHWPWSWPVQAIRVLWIELVMRPLVWLLAAPRVVVEEELLAGPMLIVVNHVTQADGALALYALPGRVRRHVAAAMLGEMLLDYRNGRRQPNWLLNLLAPAAYWLLTALFNVFPLPQTRGFRRSFAHAGEAMDRGYSVMIFPEGGRSQDGTLRPFRSGIGLLAQESNVPIVPVALAGLWAMKTGQVGWFHSGKLQVRVGKAIPVETQQGDPAQVAAMLEEAMRELLLSSSQNS
jgi:long-chain acyl-CoA synthetase